MKLDDRAEKSLERAKSLTLARIVAKNKRPEPVQVRVTPEGKVRVETRCTLLAEQAP